MLLLSLGVLVGCHASASVGPRATLPDPGGTPRTNPPASPQPIRSEAETLESYAREIAAAKDGPAEAAALERLHRYERDRNLTYDVTTTAVNSPDVVQNASLQTIPLQARVQIFRGQVPVYQFTFVPRDNRNLALMGK